MVTGATGFTGSCLTKKLVSLGLTVRAIARPCSQLGELEQLPIEWFRGNVYDPKTVALAAEEVEYIFHVAAAFRKAKIEEEEYTRVHIESTKLLAAAALQNSSFKRFVHVSTIGVHGHIKNPPAREDDPFDPDDTYQRTKARAELWLSDFASKNNLPFTIIRPTGIFGPGDRRLFKVFRMAAKPIFPILGYGKCLYHYIHVDDLTDAMLLAATHKKALGEAFIIGNTEPLALEDAIAIISKVLGKNPRIVRIPVAPFFLLADACEAICRPLHIEPPIYRRRVAFFTKDRSFDTSKMQKVLGFCPFYSNESGLSQTANWYAEHDWL